MLECAVVLPRSIAWKKRVRDAACSTSVGILHDTSKHLHVPAQIRGNVELQTPVIVSLDPRGIAKTLSLKNSSANCKSQIKSPRGAPRITAVWHCVPDNPPEHMPGKLVNGLLVLLLLNLTAVCLIGSQLSAGYR